MYALASETELLESLDALRSKLEAAFNPDTAVPGTISNVPSAGHCAAVASIVHRQLGGQLVSTMVSGISHWFNRFEICGKVVDVDITGDQFGFPAIRIAGEGELFSGTRVRQPKELHSETLRRSSTLAQRAGIEL
jgi:hypothetical protein